MGVTRREAHRDHSARRWSSHRGRAYSSGRTVMTVNRGSEVEAGLR
jgi:hypothetical protein